MKQAQLTISYTVYPPEYQPGDGYKLAKNLKAAMRLARKYGVGAEIWRQVDITHRRRTGSLSSAKAYCSASFSRSYHMTMVAE